MFFEALWVCLLGFVNTAGLFLAEIWNLDCIRTFDLQQWEKNVASGLPVGRLGVQTCLCMCVCLCMRILRIICGQCGALIHCPACQQVLSAEINHHYHADYSAYSHKCTLWKHTLCSHREVNVGLCPQLKNNFYVYIF